jgi:hypothetical protein
MPQSDSIERKTDEHPSRIKPPRIVGRSITLFVFAGAAVLTAIALHYRGFGTVPAWVSFLTENLLNLLLFAVVVIQARIYHQQRQVMHNQWDAMQKQVDIMSMAVDPRLRIMSVKVENLEVGGEPIFVVSIINEGATDAKDVTLNMRVNLREGDRLAMKWSHPQIVTIAAHQEQHYFLRWRTTLEQELLDDINQTAPLKVSGYFQLPGKEQTEFCYLYYPWRGKRPEGISQFIPCDFNPGLTHVMKLGTGHFKTTGSPSNMTITRATEQKQKAEKNPDQAEPAQPETDTLTPK